MMKQCFIGHQQASQMVGDPVDVINGANIDKTLDFRLTGPLELWWYRHYDSSESQRKYILGWGHTHHFDRQLRLDADGISYLSPVGKTIGFSPLIDDGAEWASQGYVLRRLSIQLYQVLHHGEPSMEFEFTTPNEPALLKRLTQGSGQIQFFYNPLNQLERIVDSASRNILIETDANGRLISLTLQEQKKQPELLLVSYSYDERGNLLNTRNDNGHGYKLCYDQENRLVRRTGRAGFNFYFTYDKQGRCVKSVGDQRLHGVALEYDDITKVTKVTRADLGVWHYFYDANGLTQIIDPLGGVQRFVMDEKGRLAMELDTNNNATRIVYDASGATVAKIGPLGHRITLPEDPNAPDPLAHRVAANPLEYQYGRLLDSQQITLPDTTQLRTLPLSIKTRSLVCVRQEQKPHPDSARHYDVRPLGVLWWPEPQTGRVFNALGKLTEQYDDFGRRRQWFYDPSGNLAEHIDFDGGKWKYEHGLWHFETSITNPIDAEVRFTHSYEGEIASCTDAGGTRSEYRYDFKDKLVEIKRHGVVRETYTRDAVGNLIAKHGRDGRELLKLEIGPGNLPVKKILASGDEHTFQYDGFGRYLSITTKKDAVEFAYDSWGNRILEKRNGQGVSQRFQSWKALAEMVFLDRFVVSYKREFDGALIITTPCGKSQQIKIHPNGLFEHRFSNGSKEEAQYDNRGRCLFKSAQRINGQVWNRSYHWSGEGELRLVEDNLSGEIRHEYDAAHRLQRRWFDGKVEHYAMDSADNLISQPGLTGVSLLEGNRLKNANGCEFVYNARNHIGLKKTFTGEVRYSYDSRDQLVHVEMPKGIWEADYDALGRRTRKTWAGQTTEYYWNSDQLMTEVDSTGRLRLYVYADPLALTPILFSDYDAIDAQPGSGQLYFIFTDQIGTPCLIEDEQGTAVWRARIAPFGTAEILPNATIEFNLRFPGHYFDAELDLHYNRFRYYDPVLGRYLQSDPWGIAGGFNLYAYRLNPLAEVDCRGLGEEYKKIGLPCPDEEGNNPPRSPQQQLDDLYGPATDPWMVRNNPRNGNWGEGENYPPEAQIVRPGEPIRLSGTGRYIYIVDSNGDMHITPENGSSTMPDGSPRRTTHVDLSGGGPARISGEINPTNDPDVWVMNDDSGRYSRRPVGPGQPLQPTRSGDNLQNANRNLNQADTGGQTIVNEADLYGPAYGR